MLLIIWFIRDRACCLSVSPGLVPGKNRPAGGRGAEKAAPGGGNQESQALGFRLWALGKSGKRESGKAETGNFTHELHEFHEWGKQETLITETPRRGFGKGKTGNFNREIQNTRKGKSGHRLWCSGLCGRGADKAAPGGGKPERASILEVQFAMAKRTKPWGPPFLGPSLTVTSWCFKLRL